MRHRRGIDLVAPIKPASYDEYRYSGSVMETVSGLREWEVLGGKCGECFHVAWLAKKQVLRKFGTQYLNNLGDKLVCQCGNRKGNTVLMGRLGRD